MTKATYRIDDDSAPPSAGWHQFTSRQASAYDNLVPVYEARHEQFQPIRQVVLDRVLDGMEARSKVLEVGCGCGATLALIAGEGFEAEGIDSSSSMALTARTRSGCPVTCADFITHTFEKRYDLVFAQAFIHLFPKDVVGSVIEKLKFLALRRVYFSTSLALLPSESWEHKDGVLRYRSRYTSSEAADLVSRSTSGTGWRAWSFELIDPLEKRWINVVLERE